LNRREELREKYEQLSRKQKICVKKSIEWCIENAPKGKVKACAKKVIAKKCKKQEEEAFELIL